MNRRNKHGGIAGKAVPAILVLACASLLVWSLIRVHAAWQFFAAETIAKNMYEAGEFTAEGVDAAQARLDKAMASYPRNPDYLELAGRLKQIRAVLPGAVGRERREWLQGAADDHRLALQVRPLWPYSWVNLLSVKDKLGELDSEFNTAMNRASETGPWEPRVQLQLIRTGVRWWDQLRRPQRELVRETAERALGTQPREVFEIAQFYLRPDLVCGRDTGHKQIERWCAEVM